MTGRTMARRAMVVVPIALTLAAGALASMSKPVRFPHEKHAGLFPTCLGCHRGIPEGDETRYFSVERQDCVRCHDGQREEAVDWEGPTPTASNLSFSHVEHASRVEREGDTALACATCHGPTQAGRPRMEVGRAAPETCVGCHAHDVPEHLSAQAPCRNCHVSLSEAEALPTTEVAAFPRPPSHEADAFILGHGRDPLDIATCAVCHARESCARCHLDPSRVSEIGQLSADARIAELEEGKDGEWPEPASHEAVDWVFEHGLEAGAASATCSNCHAEASCRTCHGAASIAAIEALPSPDDGPKGVVVERTRPPGHLPDFGSRHGTAAASDLPRCASCHVENECAACHENPRDAARAPEEVRQDAVSPGTGLFSHQEPKPFATPADDLRPGYHPENFILRHGAEAFAVQTSCGDCHSTEVFCRECHTSVGMGVGVDGGAGGAFHDAQPNWLFEHGRAARQGLEECATCHQQTSCLRCHSARAGLRINPHGPGFDATRVSERSTMACGVCHTARQLQRP